MILKEAMKESGDKVQADHRTGSNEWTAGPVPQEALNKLAGGYTIFSDVEKSKFLSILKQYCPTEQEFELGLAQLNCIERFSTLKEIQIKRWQNEKPNKGNITISGSKPGPKINEDFESTVLAQVMLTSAVMCTNEETRAEETLVRVLHNVAYSYQIIRYAALEVQKFEEFQNEESGVRDLQFSDKWIYNFLGRQNMRRRKITREKKNPPPVSEVRRIMRVAQEKILELGFLPTQVLNLDETAINFGVGPSHVFAAANADRGEQEVCDAKGRITGVPIVDADGGFLPTFYILKHSRSSESNPDQTKMMVIRQLHKKPGYTVDDGWEEKEWSRVMTIKGKTCLPERKIPRVHP